MFKCSCLTGLTASFTIDNVQSANRRVLPLACSNVRFVFKCLQTPCHVADVERFYAKSTRLVSASAHFVRINHSTRKWNEGSAFYWKNCRIPANTAGTRFRKGTSTCTIHIALNALVIAASQVASSSLTNRLKRCDT